MKRYIVYSFMTIILLALISTAVVSKASAAPPTAPYVGRWESIDLDGSYQTLTISGGKNLHNIDYRDNGASLCGLDENGDPLYAASFRGKLTSDGLTLSGTVDVYCLTRPPSQLFENFYVEYTYQPENDTLIDGSGLIWNRR